MKTLTTRSVCTLATAALLLAVAAVRADPQGGPPAAKSHPAQSAHAPGNHNHGYAPQQHAGPQAPHVYAPPQYGGASPHAPQQPGAPQGQHAQPSYSVSPGHYYYPPSYGHSTSPFYGPPHGSFYGAPPPGYHAYHYHGVPYYYYGGYWYRPFGSYYYVTAPPIGLVASFLPPYYTTLWYGGMPYYYANNVYYSTQSGGGYVVTDPPQGTPDRVEAPAPAGEDFFMYPRNGQSADQQAHDRYECHRWAVEQTRFDPTLAQGGVTAAQSEAKHADYLRAMSACLEARGYTVR